MGERDRSCEQQNTNGEGEARERKYMRFMIDDDDSLSLLPAFRPSVLPHVQNLIIITCHVSRVVRVTYVCDPQVGLRK